MTAIVAEHSGGTDPVVPEGAVARAIIGVSENEYPRIHAAREHMLSGTPHERFGWAVEVLLRGILLSPRAATVNPSAATTKTQRPPKRRQRAR